MIGISSPQIWCRSLAQLWELAATKLSSQCRVQWKKHTWKHHLIAELLLSFSCCWIEWWCQNFWSEARKWQFLRMCSRNLAQNSPERLARRRVVWSCNTSQSVTALHQSAPGQMTWLEDPPPLWLRPAYYFASVIMWTENINFIISGRFICFISTIKQSSALAACVLRATTNKGSSTFFEEIKCTRVTQLEDFLTSKWPGSFTALAPPLVAIV